MISGCKQAPKDTTPSSVQKVSQAPDLTDQIKALNADLSILRDKVDSVSNNLSSISDDYTKLKASPALKLTDQVKKLNADLSILRDKVDSISNNLNSINLNSISNNLKSISNNVDSISNDYAKLASRITALEPSNALLSTVSEGYTIASTKFGPFIITKKGASQYQDGFKVKLGIGNFTSATFKGAKLHVTWGVLSGQDKKWINEQSKEFNITDELSSGAYTNVEIALTPAKADEIKTIQVGIELSQIYLKTR